MKKSDAGPDTTEKIEEEKSLNPNTIVGISVISSIVEKATNSSPNEIFAAMKQILFFYRLLPDKWKKKAYYIFEKLWNRKKVVVSTDPEQVERIYEVDFGNTPLNDLFLSLPQNDKAILIQGKSMMELIDKGLHSDSDETKKSVEERYGQRGLNIVNMLTTKDVEYLLEELEDLSEQKAKEKLFNEWALNYDSIAVLVPPIQLSESQTAIDRILEVSKKQVKPYILVNLSGKMEDCTGLLELVHKMKEDKVLNYSSITPDIFDSGFCKSIRIRIDF